MKKLVVTLTALAAFIAPGFAADMAAKAPMRAAAVAYAPSWTGCYLGAGGGGAMTNNDNYLYNAAGQLSLNKTDGARGWFGTVQGGCDYQFAGKWVVGAFADYDFSDIKGDHLGFNLNQIGQQKQDWSWAVGGRIGYLIVPQLLTYVSAGYTQAHWKSVNYGTAVFPGGPANFTTPGYQRGGWFVGAGDEYALSLLPGLFWKTEYRYSEFDARNSEFLTLPALAPTGQFIQEKFRSHSVRSELVYRFNWGGGAVVAKY